MEVVITTHKQSPLGVTLLLILALLAFAANSVLARLALENGHIDPWSFTLIRIGAGAVFLTIITGLKRSVDNGNWRGALWLFIYAVFFSLAYVKLPTGTGALILFAGVQITMISGGFFKGERLAPVQWLGLVMAILGLILLLSPSLERPSPLGAIMMLAAGIGWGLYSLKGQGSSDAIGDTSGNFLRLAVVLVLMTPGILIFETSISLQIDGIAYALISGIITSALGYVIWYKVLKDITAVRAAISQLTVPVIAALGGLILLSEPITPAFLISSVIILGGVGLATLSRHS